MKPGDKLMRHFLQFKDFRAEEYAYLFERAAIIKRRFKNYERYQPLVDRFGPAIVAPDTLSS